MHLLSLSSHLADCHRPDSHLVSSSRQSQARLTSGVYQQTVTGQTCIWCVTWHTVTGQTHVWCVTWQTVTGQTHIWCVTWQTVTGQTHIWCITWQTVTGQSRIWSLPADSHRPDLHLVCHLAHSHRPDSRLVCHLADCHRCESGLVDSHRPDSLLLSPIRQSQARLASGVTWQTVTGQTCICCLSVDSHRPDSHLKSPDIPSDFLLSDTQASLPSGCLLYNTTGMSAKIARRCRLIDIPRADLTLVSPRKIYKIRKKEDNDTKEKFKKEDKKAK